MKRVVATLLVLAAVMAVQAAPENSEPTRIQESECYDCHKAGGEGVGPVLQDVFRMFLAEAPDLTEGASTNLTFDIRNWWTAEMKGFSGHIDLSYAPAFSFEATKAPVSGSREGQLPEYAPADYFQGTERSTRITADVAAGGTDLTLTLSPKEGDNIDLILRIWPPGLDPERDTPIEIDEGGNGEPETFVTSGDPLLGGPYIIEVAEDPPTFNAPSGDMFEAVGFNVDWMLSYRFDAGDPVRTGASLVVLDGQDDRGLQETQISWPVNVVSEITEEQRIRVYMESAAFYDHPPQFRAVDEWLYWNDVEYVITPEADGTVHVQRMTPDGILVTEFIVGEQVIEVATPQDEGPDLTVEDEAEIDAWAMTIGYMSSFLLVLSLLTGGAFGNWSRRIQQFFVYRRAKKRVAFHNVISYGLLLTATIHMVLFLIEARYPWSVGFFFGSVSILGLYLSGITGLYQRVMVRGMGHEAWRWLHYLSFVMAFAGAAGHILLDGIHFATFQETLGWEDPVAPFLEELIPIDNSTAPSEPAP